MSRGTTYFGLLATLRAEELLYEARQRNCSTTPIPRRRARRGLSLLQRFRRPRR